MKKKVENPFKFDRDRYLVGLSLLGFFLTAIPLFSDSIFDLLVREATGPEIQVSSKDKGKAEAVGNKIIELPDPPLETSRITGLPVAKPLTYTHQLYDFYDNVDGRFVPRVSQRRFVKMNLPVAWSLEGAHHSLLGQLSSRPDFSSIAGTFMVSAREAQGVFKNVFLGKNYFRVLSEGKGLSTEPQEFLVQDKPLHEKPPQLAVSARTLYILEESAQLKTQVKADADLVHLLVEESDHPEFPPEQTRVLWSQQKIMSWNISEPREFYFRVRGVNARWELTAPSDAVAVRVERPGMPELPRLAQGRLRLTEEDTAVVSWDQSKNAEFYEVRIKSNDGKIVESGRTRKNTLSWRPKKSGQYRISIVSVDQFKRRPRGESVVSVLVDPLPQVPIPPLALEEAPKREVASTPKLSTKVPSEIPRFLNFNFQSSKLAFEGAAFTMYSQDQLDQGKANPTAFMFGVRSIHWMDPHGVEASFKTKVLRLSSVEGGDVAPMQAEARYHYKFDLPFNPFSRTGKAEMSLLAGYETYKNSAGGLFSPKYDLIKAGMAFNFPVIQSWDTGGELVYGQGLDKSTKYEVSGFLSYFLDPSWSLGAGYRIHLFIAGSDASSPLGVPYREGFGEGYSTLRWHY